MGVGQLSLSLLALAGGALGADLPSITMKVCRDYSFVKVDLRQS